ncbi:hypothetical protein ACOMHN_045875 [Nucella lapillus]
MKCFIRKPTSAMLVFSGSSFLLVIVLQTLGWGYTSLPLPGVIRTGETIFAAEGKLELETSVYRPGQAHEAQIHIATVACGERVEEGLMMVKSAAILTTSRLMLHIFSESSNHHNFSTTLDSWPGEVRGRVGYRLYPITTPDDPDAKGWENPQWRPCSNHRLFLPSFLPDVDAVIYLDSDILLLTSVNPAWGLFGQFSADHMLAMAPDSEKKVDSWYKQVARTPYVPPTGVNSGVILMNLTRMRQSRWTKRIVEYSQIYRKVCCYPTRILSISISTFFQFLASREKLYHLDCSWNYRNDHCVDRHKDRSCVCGEAERHGAYILQGKMRAFEKKQPFHPVYAAFKKVGGGNVTDMLREMEHSMKQAGSPCSLVTTPYFKRLAPTVADLRHPAKPDPAGSN